MRRVFRPTTFLTSLALGIALLASCGSDSNALPLATNAQPGTDGSGAEVPTVDISGVWQGRWYSEKGPDNGLLANLILSQTGNDLTGNLQVIGAELIVGTRPVFGNIFGLKIDAIFDGGLADADCLADVNGIRMSGTYQFRVPFPDEFGTFYLKHD